MLVTFTGVLAGTGGGVGKLPVFGNGYGAFFGTLSVTSDLTASRPPCVLIKS